MEAFVALFENAFSYIKTIRLTDAVDILIVAFLIYKVCMVLRKTNSRNLARSIILLIVIVIVSYLFNLTMINFLLRKATELGLIALVVLFQPELRRMLERVGSTFTSSRSASSPVLESALSQTVLACSDMSRSRTGALIIFERSIDLGSIMNTGTLINADVTAELLKNLFYNKAPLHDGAVIIKNARVAAAGCVLPLTKSQNLSKDLGMRHRAGIGLSEQSDAVVLIVSEETGAISMAIDGMLKRHLNDASLTQLLHAELIQEPDEKNGKKFLQDMLAKLFRRKKV